MDRSLTEEDLLSEIEQVPITPDASGRWLTSCPEKHLLAIHYAWTKHGDDQTCTMVMIRITLALLEREERTPVRAGDLHQFLGWVAAAVELEWGRRQGWLTISPPLQTIFDPHKTLVSRTEACPNPKGA